mmetsp:Transcript_27411/g.41497  ORF Transcript_27411/g.41497 Transcript_27411/m.41497 type:complete len:212 (-) Transcript_27411:288-923(-)|eukprot:CAMPEP_0178920212 /NCGR_PEP_ID=MMETSP0786-20121207/14881_1 /TAXON_ID=186022 /ORGANISM="Thalassionema frauenfeldii, Strain CCMP 1798" /LENGTH=211 /DNA_ID=CAMNT_0020594257 /DNA_START=65 /DNA_END=700 /DNA_ORIENTATION=-
MRTIGFRFCQRAWMSRFFSTTREDASSRLLLSLSSSEEPYDQVPKILYPRDEKLIPVTSMDDIHAAIDNHCGSDDLKTVWFTPSEDTQEDPMKQFYSVIQPSILRFQEENQQKQQRFGIYTSGTISPTNMEELAIFSNIQVSLLAANPIDYCKAAGVFREELFGDVMNFLVDAEEITALDDKIEVSVIKKYAEDGKELAAEYGISNVQVYP